MFGRFYEFCNVEKVQNIKEENPNICWLHAKIDDKTRRVNAPKYSSNDRLPEKFHFNIKEGNVHSG